MKPHTLACILALLSFCTGASAKEQPLADRILALELGMPKEQVEKNLEAIGKFVRDERKRQQIWEVRDPSFSHIIVGFDADQHLRYVTAVAREDKDAKRLRYSEIGDVAAAHQAGDVAVKNFNYEWRLPSRKDKPDGLVIARGRDPEFVTTYSLKRLDDSDPE